MLAERIEGSTAATFVTIGSFFVSLGSCLDALLLGVF
jgi:hypothetical protein